MGGRGVWVLAALAVLSLSACATPYQPHRSFRLPSGGYTNFEAQPGIIYVSFQGNGSTRRPAVVRHWHRRASELCPGGYEMLEHADISKTGITTSGGEVQSYRRPGMEGYIRCTEE